jgi:hypothetical protein
MAAMSPALSSDVSAECLACSVSLGVTIHLKDGTTLIGYLPWNDAIYDYLAKMDCAQSFLKQKGWPISRTPDKDFTKESIGLINHILSSGKPEEIKTIGPLVVYESLEPIRVGPISRYVGIESRVHRPDNNRIATIERNSRLKLAVDMTGISTLPKSLIRRMQTEKPAFVVEDEDSTSAEVYAAYGATASCAELVGALMRRDIASGRAGGQIAVNGIKLPAMQESNTNNAACKAVVSMLNSFKTQLADAIASCRAEEKRLGPVKKTPFSTIQDPIALERWREKAKECDLMEKKFTKDYWGKYSLDLRNEQQLKNVGIIHFGYAWD